MELNVLLCSKYSVLFGSIKAVLYNRKLGVVSQCDNLKQIADYILSYKSNVIVIDEDSFPEDNIFEIEKYIKCKYKYMKIIICSSNFGKDNISQHVMNGVYDYLIKPFSTTRLIESIKLPYTYIDKNSDFIGNSQKIRVRKEKYTIRVFPSSVYFGIDEPIKVPTHSGVIECSCDYAVIEPSGEAYPIKEFELITKYKACPENMLDLRNLQKPITLKSSNKSITIHETLWDTLLRYNSVQNVEPIEAVILEKSVKLFSEWDKENYIFGNEGDILLLEKAGSPYIINKETFGRHYDIVS